MADGHGRPNNSQEKSVNRHNIEDLEDQNKRMVLDLGDDNSRLNNDSNRLGFQSAEATGSADAPKREDNPFSFKHFLRSDVHNYQNKGARPKVYCEGRTISSVSDLEFPHSPEMKQTRIVPEYSSALPDFVQDHLVVEQCYLGNGPSNSFNLDINLPDFTPNRDGSDSSHNNNRRSDNSINTIPLDLPIRAQTSGFPLDLPGTPPVSPRNGVGNEVGVSKSLPDFLADGAVRNQSSDGQSVESPERECDRLRRELEIVRGQLFEQNRRVHSLTRELENSRTKEDDYTRTLIKALEQVEESLEQSNMRTATAEKNVVKLKQEMNVLVNQLNSLKSENRALRGEEGAAGGHDYYASNELYSQRLAQELKAAASTAEHSLRQLLTGVDNLRTMAATLENIHRIEEKQQSFIDLDEDSGPAL